MKNTEMPVPPSIVEHLLNNDDFLVHQVYEVAEHFGYETRNKYQILDKTNTQIFYVAEQQKGLLGFLFRQSLGHWRRYSLNFYDSNRNKLFEAKHPFTFFFQRLDLFDGRGQLVGRFQQRFGLLRYRFQVSDHRGQVVFQMRTGIRWFLLWSFPFYKNSRHVATVDKKFSGIFTEFYTDKDNFLVSFKAKDLNFTERLLVLASSIFIDLMYFETKK